VGKITLVDYEVLSFRKKINRRESPPLFEWEGGERNDG